MSIVDRLVRRLCARPLEALVREAVTAQVATITTDPLHQPLIYGDATRLHIHPTAVVNNALFNLSSGDITVGQHAFFGHNVAILTGTHDFTKFGAERQVAVPKTGRDVVIGEGAWLASFAIVVGPCSIGAHAVVGVGSLVLDDVAPYTAVAARQRRYVVPSHARTTNRPRRDRCTEALRLVSQLRPPTPWCGISAGQRLAGGRDRV